MICMCLQTNHLIDQNVSNRVPHWNDYHFQAGDILNPNHYHCFEPVEIYNQQSAGSDGAHCLSHEIATDAADDDLDCGDPTDTFEPDPIELSYLL